MHSEATTRGPSHLADRATGGCIRSGIRSSQMMSGALFIFDEQSDKRAQSSRLHAAPAICSADLECQPPLLEQHTVRGKEAVARVVDVGRFRGHAVQLDNLKATPLDELLYRWRAHVEAPKVKSLEATADLVESA